jgi:hypothetical protein
MPTTGWDGEAFFRTHHPGKLACLVYGRAVSVVAAVLDRAAICANVCCVSNQA